MSEHVDIAKVFIIVLGDLGHDLLPRTKLGHGSGSVDATARAYKRYRFPKAVIYLTTSCFMLWRLSSTLLPSASAASSPAFARASSRHSTKEPPSPSLHIFQYMCTIHSRPSSVDNVLLPPHPEDLRRPLAAPQSHDAHNSFAVSVTRLESISLTGVVKQMYTTSLLEHTVGPG